MSNFVFVAFMFFALLSTPNFFGSVHVSAEEDDTAAAAPDTDSTPGDNTAVPNSDAAPDNAATEETLASNADSKNPSVPLSIIPGMEPIKNEIANITNSLMDSQKGVGGWISKSIDSIGDGIKKIGSSLGNMWDHITQPLKHLWPFNKEKKA
ncbi:hypothetical protein PV327_004575 [Microctonus hyperodae]|uniref:Secreted protein n=1 Tax=Microctonus hyperodae TaxID=165561 RepID=A0AA39KMR0_MICHY|nr:hypothetical protein PV327_004575 [Microctonus hyperodae]